MDGTLVAQSRLLIATAHELIEETRRIREQTRRILEEMRIRVRAQSSVRPLHEAIAAARKKSTAPPTHRRPFQEVR